MLYLSCEIFIGSKKNIYHGIALLIMAVHFALNCITYFTTSDLLQEKQM